jgi:hypothetical protein
MSVPDRRGQTFTFGFMLEMGYSPPLIERSTAAWSLHISLPPFAAVASCPDLRKCQDSCEGALLAFPYCQLLAHSSPTLLEPRVAVMS